MSSSAFDEGELPARPEGIQRAILGFRIQGRVIHALLMREMTTRFGRGQLGFLWLVIEPLMLASAIGLIHWAGVRGGGHSDRGTIPIFLFYVVGYAPFFAFRAIINRAPSALHANMTLMYHRQVRLTDVMIARNLLEAAAIFGVLALIIGGATWFVDRPPYSLPTAAAALVIMFAMSNGISMLIAAAAARWELVDRITHPLTYLSLPFSGAFFWLHDLPPSWRESLLWSPQPHIHEMLREGMFGPVTPAYYDPIYMMWWVLGLNLLGLAAIRAVRPRLEF